MFNFTNASVFNLDAVDLAEFSTSDTNSTVHFMGYRHDGTIVTIDLSTDGIIDGTGPLADFQTFTFPKEFTDLDRVQIPGFGWALDNLSVSYLVPEPAVTHLALLAAALASLRFLERRR